MDAVASVGVSQNLDGVVGELGKVGQLGLGVGGNFSLSGLWIVPGLAWTVYDLVTLDDSVGGC